MDSRFSVISGGADVRHEEQRRACYSCTDVSAPSARNFRPDADEAVRELCSPARFSPGFENEAAMQPRHARGLNRRALEKAYAYIEDHLGEHFTLEDLAHAACVSRFHFARAFRSSTGYSPMAYLLKSRIERAKEILAYGEQKICETAVSLGFFDQSHFARSFRRQTGFSPREFVRLMETSRWSGPARRPSAR